MLNTCHIRFVEPYPYLIRSAHVYVIESSAHLRTWQFFQHVTTTPAVSPGAVQNTSATTQFFRAKGL
jgi:hypothetical protein